MRRTGWWGASAKGNTIAYRYDPLGRRSAKDVDGVVTEFLSAGIEEIVEFDGAGNLLRRYIHGLNVDERLVYVDYPGGSPVTSYYHTNRSGSTVAMTDATGAGIAGQQYRYSPYGVLS